MRYTSLTLFLLLSIHSFAQSDSVKSLKLTTYVDVYYSYDFSKPANFEKPDFNYNYKKHNQLNVNLAFAKLGYQSSRIRSSLAIMAGNYVLYNLTAEPNWAKPFLECNLGYKPFKQTNFWIDAGVLPSHIGFESAIGSECWNLTRSILAENSPYFETGIRFSYTNKKDDVYFAFHLLNGWQQIAITKGKHMPSVGIQLNIKPSNSITLNYSNFIGQIQSDSGYAFRVFHNLYAIYQATPSIACILGFDIGTQRNTSKKVTVWYTPVLIGKLNLNDKSRIAARLEYYSDQQQTIISTATPNGYRTFGTSINYDYQISSKILWRTELKQYKSKDPIFIYQDANNSYQTSATMALILKL